jgi:protein XagA
MEVNIRMSKLFLITLLILSTSKIQAGGGWPQPKGALYLKLSEWWVISDQHYTNTGGIDPQLTRGTFNTSIYSEYGFTDRLTGIIYFPFFSRSTLNEQKSATTGNILVEGDAVNSIGDTDIAIKYGFIHGKPVVVSGTLLLGLPLGNDSGGRDGSLQTGDGEFNQMITLDASTSFKLLGLFPFVSVSAGFNNRTNDFSDEFRYGVEVGVTYKKVTLITRLIGVESLQNGADNFSSSGSSVFANNTEYMSFSPELAFNFTSKLGVSASYATAFSGRLIFANPSFSVGVFLKL